MSYLGKVLVGDGYEESHFPRGSRVLKAGTYLGVSPEMTTVLYSPDDKLGMLSAIASLVPIGLCVALLTIFLCRRTANDLWVGGGQIVCEVLNGVLKVIIRQPRPSSPVSNMPMDSSGMPSAHAQYMGYYSAISIIQTLGAPGISRMHRALRIVLVLGISWFTSFSRYYLYYHTGQQVVVGYLVGVVLGIFWLKLEAFVSRIGLLRWAISLWPCRLMLVKDVDYSVAREYDQWKQNEDIKQKRD